MEGTRYFLIDDDPVFCSGLTKLAGDYGVELDTYCSPLEFDQGTLGKYHAGIVDVDLGGVQGPELGSYLGALFNDCPIMYISSMDVSKVRQSPGCADVENFVSKTNGFRQILGETMKMGR